VGARDTSNHSTGKQSKWCSTSAEGEARSRSHVVFEGARSRALLRTRAALLVVACRGGEVIERNTLAQAQARAVGYCVYTDAVAFHVLWCAVACLPFHARKHTRSLRVLLAPMAVATGRLDVTKKCWPRAHFLFCISRPQFGFSAQHLGHIAHLGMGGGGCVNGVRACKQVVGHDSERDM
jgi:hypothetical protein